MEWPLDLPAEKVLALPGRGLGDVAWAAFDAGWYCRTHGLPPDTPPEAALSHYLAAGQAEGHSPNIFFDEHWHRLEYPGIAAAIADRHYASAFDAYCRRGCLDRSAHWLFNELLYRDRYDDLTDQVFAENGIANGYDHYLRHGVHEGRSGHLLFDADTYLANFDAADIADVRRTGAFQHYLLRLEAGAPELRTSIYFDPGWYLQRYPEIAAAIAAGRWKSALHHYLCNDTPTAFDPLEDFSEAHYLRNDPGLRQVIVERHFRNGYMHFLRYGAPELRSPSPTLDLGWYAAQPAVRAELGQGRVAHAFAHWLSIGRGQGLSANRPAAGGGAAEEARATAARMAEALLPTAGRFPCRFDAPADPVVSVVIVVRDAFASTMATIQSLRASTVLPLELILIDLGSADETRAIGSYVPGAKLLRLDANAAWAQAAEAGRQLASAPRVLFLAAACQLGLEAIDRACVRLDADPAIGAIGGLVLQPHGIIAQAGGIVWQDGRTHPYMHGESPLAPEANFARAVDFCAPAFLLARADLLNRLDGFDFACAPGHEVVDLCLRIGAAGLWVVYDPSVLVTETGPGLWPEGNCPQVLAKHAPMLATHARPGGPAVQVHARHAGPRPQRILFIEDTVPLRRIGSGFVRSNDIVRAMAELGAGVTVFPVNGCDHPPSRIYGDLPDTVEVMHALSLDQLSGFLRGRDGYYDLVWIARAHNLQKTRPVLAQLFGAELSGTRVVLDTEAVTPFRQAQMAALAGTAFDPEPELAELRALAQPCAATIAVTPEEAAALRERGLGNVLTIGHALDARPTARGFSQRTGLLFVGAIHTADSPNMDSLDWFTAEVLPLIEAELGWETRLSIAGYAAPGIDLGRFSQHPRITLRGALPELDPLYNAHRIFIAPTRYAAGAPYKVLEAASRGLPVVCTDILQKQVGWTPGQEIIASPADPAQFAAAILTLYRDEALWHRIRDGALERLRRDHGWEDFTRSVAQALAASAP